MSLRDAVLEIAEQMEEDVKAYQDASSPLVADVLRSYARQLRTAWKSAEDPPALLFEGGRMDWPYPADALKREMARQAERDREDAERRTRAEEGVGASMTICVNGPADNVTVPVPPDMPRGAKTLVAGGVYVLTEDGLLYDDAETVKHQEQIRRNTIVP